GKLEEIADFVIEHDRWVISDEVYEKFNYEGRHLSIGALNGMEERAITLNSFSKTYGMTGWRVGYVIAWKELIERISRFSLYTIVCPSSFVQRGAISAFKGSQDFFHKVLKEYKRRRDIICKRLEGIDGVSLSEPEGTFYCFPDICGTGLSSEEFFWLLFKKAKVGCVPGSIFGKAGEGKVRFSFAVSTRKIEKAFERIKRVL
ncbi:MAG: pyridoxal phosphate-dependent aminotransferase, partial [Candidatus Methanofastidiosia archaeon]